jgi:hypothetical protein
MRLDSAPRKWTKETGKKGEGSAVSRQVRPRVARMGQGGERLKTEGGSASWPGHATIQSLSLSPSCRSRSPSGGQLEDDRRWPGKKCLECHMRAC